MAYQFRWSDFRSLPTESILEITETYLNRNNNLFEANTTDSVSYFENLSEFSLTPVIGKHYLITLLVLNNDRIIVGEPPTTGKVLHKTQTGYYVEFADGRKTDFPDKEIGELLCTSSFYFGNNIQYDKLRTAVSMKYDTQLPAAPQGDISDDSETTDEDLLEDTLSRIITLAKLR